MENKNNVVVNSTQGYGYTYATLSDIALQGFAIPKMKTETDPVSLRDYVYYYDEDFKTWVRGAEIVVPESPKNSMGKDKMNAAQLYGSALTYARRYTVLLADQLATDDDKGIDEKKEEIFDEPTPQEIKKLVDEFKKLYSNEEIARILNNYKIIDIEKLDYEILGKYVNDRKK